MRRRSCVVAIVVLIAGTGGCGEPEQLFGFGTVIYAYNLYGYPSDPTGQRTSGPKYLQRSGSEVGTRDWSTEQHLELTVEMLLYDFPSPGLDNFWAEACAPGQEVEEVELRSDLVIIRMAGEVPGRETCVMNASER